jgi:hypothetical protein
MVFNVLSAFLRSEQKPSGEVLIRFMSGSVFDAQATFKGIYGKEK